MGKVRNLLRQVKERVEVEIREFENQQQQGSSLRDSLNYDNTQQTPSLLGLLTSSIEKATLGPSPERPVPSDDNRRYVTVFCETCLHIKKYTDGVFSQNKCAAMSLAGLESAVEDGCHFCSLLTQGLYALMPDIKGKRTELNLWQSGNSVVMRVMKEEEGGWKVHDILQKGEVRESQKTFWNQMHDEYPTLEFLTTRQAPFPLDDLGISAWGRQECLPTPGDTSSAASLENAVEWIKDCAQQHRSCDRSVVPLLPTRILDAESWPMVKLREPEKKRAQYIALSHSWGGHHPIATTTSTLLEYKKGGININALPKTYQDAIAITRRLGHRYIWIDSLCIIQDSKPDWEHEAARMAEVYQNAWLTISATRSSSPTSGCYNSTEKQTVELRGVIRNSPFILHARRAMEHVPSDWGVDPKNAPMRRFPLPLLTRGWAFQERLLSARVLHFGPQELFWECRERVTCECKGIKEWDRDANIVTYQGAPPKITQNRFVNSAAKRDQMHARWRSLVEEYSRRRLTVGTDRLPAFAGLATEMQGYLSQRYFAGLWEDSFVADLCWHRGEIKSGRGRVRKRGGASWPGIPSWSWAAVDCEIDYASDLLQPDHKKVKAPTISRCEILEIQWTPTGSDAYMVLEACVIPGRICIHGEDHRGNIYELLDDAIKAKYTPPTGYQPSVFVRVQGYVRTLSVDFPLYSEGEWYIEEGEEIFCAKIAVHGENDDGGEIVWLVLKCLDAGAQVYERIGIIASSMTNWDCTDSKKRIKVV